MAILCQTSGDGLTRDGSYLDPAQSWTKARWVRFSSLAVQQVVFQVSDGFGGAPSTPPDIYAATDVGTSTVYSAADNAIAGNADAGASVVVDTWYYIATTYDAGTTTVEGSVNGVATAGAFVLDMSAVATMDGEWLGTDTASAGNIALAYDRAWQAKLSLVELAAEMASQTAVRTSGLLADTPLSGPWDLADLTANNRDWTALGTVVATADPLQTDTGYLIRDCAVASYQQSDQYIGFWMTDGAFIGSITMPVNTFEQDEFVVTVFDNRIYILDGGAVNAGAFRIYDGDGNLLDTIDLDDPVRMDTAMGSGIYSPFQGEVWVGINATDGTGEIWKYDTDGTFVEKIATGLTDGDIDLLPYFGLGVVGRFIYFNAVSSAGFETYGVYKYDRVNGGNCILVVPSQEHPEDTEVFLHMCITPNAEILVSYLRDVTSPSSQISELRRYSLTGTLLQTYVLPAELGSFINGIAADPDGAHLWVGNGDFLVKFAKTTGAIVESFSSHFDTDDGEQVSGSVLATPRFTPDEPVAVTYAIRRLRRAPHLNDTALNIFHHRFVLDLEAGLGTTDAPTTAPLMYLRWSDDGGHTWSEHDHTLSAGSEGQYKKRLFRNRLGKSRDRIYEVSTTDPAVWNLVAAYLALTPGTS